MRFCFELVVWSFVALSSAGDDYAQHTRAEADISKRACGPWLQQWHNLPASASIVRFERPPTGVADIWSSLVTAFWYAVTGRKRLEVHWPEATCCVLLNDFTPSSHTPRLLNLTYYKQSHLDFKKRWRDSQIPAGDVHLSGNRGATHWLFEHMKHRVPRGVPEEPIRAAGCVLHRLAKPTPEVFQLAKPLLRAVKGAVCVHVRTGLMLPTHKHRRPDDEMHGASLSVSVANVSAFVHCANTLDPDKPIFVAADSDSLRRDFIRTYGERKVRLSPWSPLPFATYQRAPSKGGTSLKRRKSFEPNALARTLAEWYALAHCDHIVASKSGFSRTAAAVAHALRNASVAYVSHPTDPLACRHSPAIDAILLQGGAGL